MEKLQLITAKFLNVLAPHARSRLGQNLDARAVGKATFRFEHASGQARLEATTKKAG
jgi:hypothetical protein